MSTKQIFTALLMALGLPACTNQPEPAKVSAATEPAAEALPAGDTPSTFQCTDPAAEYNASGAWLIQRAGGSSGNIDPQLGVDGDFNTFTTAAWLDQSDVEVAYSVSPQDGVVFPGGTTPGFWMAREQANEGLFIRSVKTRLNGVIQDEHLSHELNGNQFNLNIVPSYFGVDATRPFDELLVQFEGGARLSDMRIFEACIDG